MFCHNNVIDSSTVGYSPVLIHDTSAHDILVSVVICNIETAFLINLTEKYLNQKHRLHQADKK